MSKIEQLNKTKQLCKKEQVSNKEQFGRNMFTCSLQGATLFCSLSHKQPNTKQLRDYFASTENLKSKIKTAVIWLLTGLVMHTPPQLPLAELWVMRRLVLYHHLAPVWPLEHCWAMVPT